ncbi:Afadin and alpha-actinin-binding-domain-containing protein, partial [Apodospora peruviana]
MTTNDNLRTASLYINNQLLSRGLLRDGETIDFTKPSSGGTATTMGRIMAVVNDLILRRDRDAEHRESLSATIRTLRAEALRQANHLSRLQEKHADASRKVSIAEAAEASLKSQLKTAEAAIHKLKEEAARQKTLVAQTRAACANEVRKRDRQIDGLKKAVGDAGRARGVGRNNGILSVSVVGEVSPHEVSSGGAEEAADGNGFYDLRTETNAFLAELAKGLSEENETLLALVRRTMQRLKEMSGWDGGGEFSETGDASAAAELAAAEIDAILEHLRTILTNPSFVPIEEVVVREDEINRLRMGWEKMESRWQEAVHLIDGWKKRMQVSGRPVNMEELKMGLRLSPVRVQNVEETAQGLGVGGGVLRALSAVPEEEDGPNDQNSPSPAERLRLVPPAAAALMVDDDLGEDVGSDISSIFEDDVLEYDDDLEDDFDVDQLDVEEPNVEILEQSVMLDYSLPLPVPPQLSPLRDNYAAGNRGGIEIRRTVVEEKTFDPRREEREQEQPPLPPPHAQMPPQQSPKKKPVRPEEQLEEDFGSSNSAANNVTEPLADSASSLDILLAKPSEEVVPKPSGVFERNQRRQPPITSNRQPVQPERKQVPLARKPVRSNTVKTTRALGGKGQDDNEGPSAPVAVASRQQRTVSAGSATSRADTTTTSVDISLSSSSTSNNNNNNTKSAASDAALMPPPPVPAFAVPKETPTKRVNSRLPLPRSGNSNNNSRGETVVGLLPPPQQSPLSMATIAAKLAASEREADAARVRAKLKAARIGGHKRVSLAPAAVATATSNTGSDSPAGTGKRSDGESSSRPSSALSAVSNTRSSNKDYQPRTTAAADDDEEEDELAGPGPVTSAGTGTTVVDGQRRYERHRPRQQQLPQAEAEQPVRKVKKREVVAKKRQTSGSSRVASRRRSTLNPWELETLIQGGAAATTSTAAGADGEAAANDCGIQV